MTSEMPTFALSYATPFFGPDPDRLVAVAKQAEACGFEGFYVPEHVALYRGARIGAWEMPTDLQYLDPLDILTFVAAHTERLLLGTSVLLLPYHHPVTLAKRLATIDTLSRGRMRLLTIGVGGLPGEAAAVGVDYTTRGRRADEAIEVLRRLWTEDENGATFHGEFFDFDSIFSYPKPLIESGLPIHVGGSSPAAARRAGRVGDGWLPGGTLKEDERQALWELVKSTAREAGRDPEAIAYARMGSMEMTAEGVEKMVAQGVTRIIVAAPAGEPEEQCAELAEFASRFGLR
ncbi:TIGR03619 family F420-dependent LLM class oxidoreductase [Catenulispora sp. NL8]|uniref:TIGR03619 family F420-dependent LLM class oxidoreductase n=1 Tax=Catenulispora pinistramenti TaxID=2705254 RepID=A0ABS5L0R9_9ACTN|nr:TIGR03619 family F420-dependent LLM class oxidoreductase [Catenulispora pinistramenti]MBS2551931.1 TIGR03619 family F420-dependent LLM class oxidoreductase [Catenulispora pinistramenti]